MKKNYIKGNNFTMPLLILHNEPNTIAMENTISQVPPASARPEAIYDKNILEDIHGQTKYISIPTTTTYIIVIIITSPIASSLLISMNTLSTFMQRLHNLYSLKIDR
jgi:hypothetical protein